MAQAAEVRRKHFIAKDRWFLVDDKKLDLSPRCAEECSRALCAASDLLTEPPGLTDDTIRGVAKDIDTLLVWISVFLHP